MMVYVVTQGCRYGGDQEQVLGVKTTREAADALAKEIADDPKRNRRVECYPDAQCIVHEVEVT